MSAALSRTRYLEDLVVGETEELGSHIFTADEIKTFAAAYDPQPFHMDEEAARASHFGALCASGWQTVGVWMRLRIAAKARRDAELAVAGLPVPGFGPSPGFRNLKWLKPIYVGDTVSFSSTLIAARPSGSRPGWGLVEHLNVGVNQHGVRVFEFVGIAFYERRPG
ncbi:MaoC family dehydratase [Alsobacter sp. KACC 23698]|uniref:MaoC family dehydratase n=1 Tax=Alsobacter sp. KACC 23698 TaxID=3149229 RepID=A0AAU7JBN8_9HYPH